MALPDSATVPRFSVTFVLAGTTNTMTFTDLIQTGYDPTYGTQADFKGLIKITDPDGVIIYQNRGWSTTAPDFTLPDIEGASPVWTKTGMTLPAAVKLGTYTFDYIASITTTGDPTRTTWVQQTKTFDYQAVMPTVTIDYTIACRTSEITSTDSTDYDITISGVSYAASVTRTHTLIKPALAGCNAPTVTALATKTFGGGGTALTDMWTGNWDTTISTVATYSLEAWGGDNWMLISATLTGADNVDVICDDCFCDLQTCMENLFNDWRDAVGTNFKREAELRTKVLKVITYWTEYEGAERCGESDDANTACQNIKDVLATEDCDCPTSTDAAPARVVAWGNGTGEAEASTFVFSTGSGVPSGGNAGDWYLRTDGSTTAVMWYNNAGSWGAVVSIFGATGVTGAAGNNSVILTHDNADYACAAAAGAQTLLTYAMPADTVATAKDVLYIMQIYQLASNANGKTVYITWDGTDIISYFTDSLVNASNNVVKLEAWISRTGSATQDYEVIATRNGLPATQHTVSTDTADFTGIINILAKCVTATSTASDITLKEFKAVYSKIIT